MYLLEHYNCWNTEAPAFGFRRYFQFTKTVLPIYAANISVWSSSSLHPYQQLISSVLITVHMPINSNKYRKDLRDSILRDEVIHLFTQSLRKLMSMKGPLSTGTMV